MGARNGPVPDDVWTKTKIVAGLDESDEWVRSAVLTIYKYQTDDEKLAKSARVHNNVGFSSNDAEFMSSIAVRLKHNLPLSPKQMAAARRTIKKYWQQLLRAVEQKGGKVDYHAHEREEYRLKKAQQKLDLKPVAPTEVQQQGESPCT